MKLSIACAPSPQTRALARHAERSLMLTVRLLAAEVRGRSLSDALTHLACGLFALDTSGRILFMNRHGEALLGHGLRVRDQRLWVTGPARDPFARNLSAMVADDAARSSRDPVPPVLIEGADGKRIALHFIPLPASVPAIVRDTFLPERVIVLAVEHSSTSIDPALVRDLLGLSHGEARLASIIGVGRSPREAAERLGVTEETARTVLKRVFLKTGTSRQAELASLLSRLAVGSGRDGAG